MVSSRAHTLLLGCLTMCILTQTAQSSVNDDACRIETQVIEVLRSVLANNSLCSCGTTPGELGPEATILKNELEIIKRDVSTMKDMLTRAFNEANSSYPSYSMENPTKKSGNATESPGSWKTNNKTYYFDDSKEVSWFTAMRACEGRNMKLATTKTQEELDYLFNHNNVQKHESVTHWWLSASDFGRNRRDFYWLDGSKLPKDSSLWRFTQPDVQDFSSCVHLAINYIHDGNKLFQKACEGTDQAFAICEK